MLARIKGALAQNREDDWKGTLATWAEAGVAGYLDSIQLHDILFYGTPRPPARKGLVKNAIIDHLAGMLQAGAAVGAWSVDDPQFTAIFLFNGLHSAVDYAQASEKRVNRTRLAQRLQHLCLRAVGQTGE